MSGVLKELSGLGVRLWVEGDQLRYRGPQRILTPDVLTRLKESKPEIVRELAEETASPLEVLDLARARFGPSQPFDPEEHPIARIPGRDPLVKTSTEKVK